nr:hypothetical protein [Candidatus Aenigmarchaeota archaeon]
NICETSLSTIFENKNKKLYDSIKKYHNETIVEYNERLKNVIKMFKPTLEKELKPFGATRNMYENDTEEKLYYMLFTGNIPEKLILVGFTYDEHLDSTTLNAEDLKKIKSIFDKQEFVKEFKKYQRSLVRKTKKLIDDLKKNQDL